MKAKWLIETTAWTDDLESFFEAIREQEMEYKQVTSDTEDVLSMFDSDDCVIFYGSLRVGKHIRRKAHWIPGVFYNATAYDCNHYYPFFGDMLLNREYIMLPFGELRRNKEMLYDYLGEDRSIFLRPNRCDKIFTGKLVGKEEFDKELDFLGYGAVDPHEIIVVARPINIVQEWRFVCVRGKVITGSTYKKNDRVAIEQGFSEEALATAHMAAECYNPDLAWVIDVGLTRAGRYCIVEIGCFSCAGLYKCDRSLIIKEVSAAAIEEWNSYRV